MSASRRHRRKKKHGFLVFVVVFTAVAVAALLLIYTGVISTLWNETQKRFYPYEHRQTVERVSEQNGLDPALVCAVIYSESGFDPSAESHVGAKGLMQLMPDTFEWLVKLRGEDYTAEDILEPEVNISYGAYYLRYLIDNYGDEETAVAAYNAGNVVADWLSDPRYSSDGVTLSSIPYAETSAYVTRVTDARGMYQSLYFEQ